MPELEFVSPTEIKLTATGEESAKTSVWLRNESTEDVRPVFSASMEEKDGTAVSPGQVRVVLVDDAGSEIAPDAVSPLPANGVGRYRLMLKGSGVGTDISGQLVATAAGVAPASVGISVSKKTVLNRGVNTALLAPFVLAAIVVFIAWAITLVPFNEPLPKLDLDFKESFASTLTAVGALLGTVISASVLPEDTVNMSKEAFTALNLLFGVAVVAAGLFYSAMQKPEWVTNKDDAAKQDRKLRGYVGPFLLACLITVWAALGEAWTLWLLVDELGQDGGFTEFAVTVFQTFLIASAIAMVFYAISRINSIVKSERKTPGATGAFAPREATEWPPDLSPLTGAG